MTGPFCINPPATTIIGSAIPRTPISLRIAKYEMIRLLFRFIGMAVSADNYVLFASGAKKRRPAVLFDSLPDLFNKNLIYLLRPMVMGKAAGDVPAFAVKFKSKIN